MKVLIRLHTHTDGDPVPDIQPGIFYYSPDMQGSTHICLCGCGEQVHLAMRPGDWTIVQEDPLTVRPAVHRHGSCYYITDGTIELI